MYIFSYKDDLTRLVIAWPLRSATTTTATAVLDRLFALLGPPSTLPLIMDLYLHQKLLSNTVENGM